MRLPQTTVRFLISNRLVICLIVVLGIFCGAAIYLAGLRERDVAMGQLEAQIVARSQVNADSLKRRINALRNNVRFLSKVPPIQGIVRAHMNGGFDPVEKTSLDLWQRGLETIFTAFVATDPKITKLRLIGFADQGRELIRVNHVGDQVVVVPTEQLQEKGDRDFFQAVQKLDAGAVYISDVTLNQENGKIAIPYVPTLRVATPIFQPDGKQFGMIVINIDANALFTPLQSSLIPGAHAYVTNSTGDFLLHPDASRNFGFDLGHRWRWEDEFHLLAQNDQQGEFFDYSSPTGLMHVAVEKTGLDLIDTSRYLNVAIVAPDTVVARAVAGTRFAMLIAILCGGLLVFAAAYLFLRQRRQVSLQQARLSSIVESSHDAIIGKALDGRITSWNKGAERMFGFSEAEAIAKELTDLIVPTDVAAEEADMLARVVRGEILANFTTRRHRRDGGLLDVSVTISPICAENGRIVGISTTVRDITAQKAAEAEVHALNASLELQVRERTAQLERYSALQHAILNHASYAIIACDTEGLITLFNPAAQHLLGYTEEEMVGKVTPAIFHDPDEVQARAVAFSEELGETIEPGFVLFTIKARRNLPNEHEWILLRKDGSRVPVLLSISALRGDDGSINGFLGIASDISARQQDQRKLLTARDQLFNAAKSAELGIWTWSLIDNMTEWNARMFELYDLPVELSNRGEYYDLWLSRLHPDDLEMTKASLAAEVAGVGNYDVVFRVMRPHGGVRYIHATGVMERDENGKPLQMLGVNRDITAQREREEILRAATVAADNANRAKSEFVANMSHEIRSPMNAVLGMLQLLRRTSLDNRQLDYASKAEAAGRALLDILNDILDFSKVEAGKLMLDPHPFSIDKMLRDLGVILSANVGTKEVEVLFDIDADLPTWVIGDALRLQQVLLNLAGNAIKFTSRGDVTLSVNMLERDASSISMTFTIRDTGIGISPEQLERIFDGFSQAEASTARRYGGTGLGLAISQKLVQLMGGELRVESRVGEGSNFHFTLQCPLANIQYHATPVHSTELQHLYCLVVDDNAAARQVLADMLASFGWQADVVASGHDALLAVAQRGEARPYDAVFVDWRMPILDGWETSVKIRELLPADKAPLIVMVTAQDRELVAERQASFEPVLDGVVFKPITASMLFDAVANATGAPRTVARPAPAVVHSAQRLAGIRLLLVEDNLVNQQVAHELLSHEGASVDVADCGTMAIDAVTQIRPSFDVILMDIQMPDMDGYTAARTILAQHGTQAPPIIAMTANVLATDREAALAAGMVDHIGKPFDLSKLVEIILLHTHKPMPSEPADVTVAAIPSESDPPGWNSAPALSRMGDNRKTYQRTLLGFSSEVKNLATHLQEALSLQQREKINRLLHTLRGLAATVGADQLAYLVSRTERAIKAGEEVPPADFDAILAASLEAVEAASRFARQFDVTRPAAVIAAAVDQSGLRAGLTELSLLLESANLRAFSVFDQLHKQYAIGTQPQFSELQRALEKMEFAEAARLCTLILQNLQ